MRHKPKVHARRAVAHTGVFQVEEMDLEFSNGARRQYQRILGTPEGAVLIVPMPDPQTVLLIREYGAGMDRYELGFPKGLVEQGESPEQAANRELQEEVGYAARRLELLSSVTVAPGYLHHTTHIVLATGLYPSRLAGDEPETLEVAPWKLAQADALLAREDFTEARSMAALFLVREHLARVSARSSDLW